MRPSGLRKTNLPLLDADASARHAGDAEANSIRDPVARFVEVRGRDASVRFPRNVIAHVVMHRAFVTRLSLGPGLVNAHVVMHRAFVTSLSLGIGLVVAHVVMPRAFVTSLSLGIGLVISRRARERW